MLICGSQIELKRLMIGLVVSEIRFTVVLFSQIDHLCNKTWINLLFTQVDSFWCGRTNPFK